MSKKGPAIITVNNLSFSYGSGKLISELSLSLMQGEILAVLGPNGVGKTTFLKILAGLLKKYSGNFEIGKEVSYVPQIFSTGVNYTVYNMVLLGRAGHMGLFSSPGELDREKTYEALKKAGIEELSQRRFSEISGGEKQLTLIARALASGAEVLLLDEPTSDLDIKNQERMLELLSELSLKSGFTIIFSTHAPSHALAVSDRSIFLGKGGISRCGATEEIITGENIKKFYSANVKVTKLEIEGKFLTYCLPIYNIIKRDKV